MQSTFSLPLFLQKSLRIAILAIVIFSQTVSSLIQYGQRNDPVSADFFINNDLGSQTVDFNNNQKGIAAATNVNLNLAAGTVNATNIGGNVLLSAVTPTSFRQWNNVILTYVGNPSKIQTTVLDCSGNNLQTFTSLPNNGILDISGVPATTSCIQTKFTFTDTITSIDKAKISWTPKPVMQTSISAPADKKACTDNIQYNVSYSMNYVDDTNVVLYVPLPSTSTNTITSYTTNYNQFPSKHPQFISAGGGGLYTPIATTVLGKTVPANSVYWAFPTMTKGTSKIVNFKINIPCGTENTTDYSVKSTIVSDTADTYTSTSPASTTITSIAKAEITKSALNLSDFSSCYPNDTTLGTLRVYPSLNPVVTYNLAVRNYREVNTEDLFFPIVKDDLSSIANKLQIECGGASLSSRVSGISNGGFLSGNQIIWDALGTSWAGKINKDMEYNLKYNVNYSGCNEAGVSLSGAATLSSANYAPVSSTLLIKTSGLGGGAECLFSKGHFGDLYYTTTEKTTKDALEHTPGNDQSKENISSFGDIISYTLGLSNSNPVRVDNIVIADMLPSDVSFISASLNSPGNTSVAPSSISGYIYYTNQSILPNIDSGAAYRGENMTGRSLTPLSDAKGIAFAITCLNSKYNPIPAGNSCYGAPSDWIGHIKVKLKENASSCSKTPITNTSTMYAYKIGDATSSDTGLQDINVIATDTTDVIASAKKGHLTSIAAYGTKDADGNTTSSYSFTVINDGKDSINNTKGIITIPTTEVNGVNEYLAVVGASSSIGNIDYSQLASGKIIVDIGTLPVDEQVIIDVSFQVPALIREGNSYDVKLNVEGNDDFCGIIDFTKTLSTTVHGTPDLTVTKQVDTDIIKPFKNATYGLNFENNGNAMATNAYVVDIIPNNTTFIKLVTNGTNTNNRVCNGADFSCTNCKVYFASASASLPSTLNPTQALTPSQIASSFTLGINNSGTWTAPNGISDPKYMAVLVDDGSFSKPAFAVGKNMCVGMTVQDQGTIPGGFIVNDTAILSDQNIQTISNQVQTTVLDIPGIETSIHSNPETTITACEEFSWIIDYFNDASDSDTNAHIKIKLPNTVAYTPGGNSITHLWNTTTHANGTIPATSQDIHASNFLASYPGTGLDVGMYILDFDVIGYKTSLNINSGALLPQEGGQFIVKAKANCSLSPNTVITAKVEANFGNSGFQGSHFSEDPVEIQNPELLINKLGDRDQAITNEKITYTLQITNKGNHSAASVQVTDTLEPHLCYVTGSSIVTTPGFVFGEPTMSGSCESGQTLTWTLGTSSDGTGMLKAQSKTINLSYKVNMGQQATQGLYLANNAYVSTKTPGDTGIFDIGDTCSILSGNQSCPNTDQFWVVKPFQNPYTTITAPTTVGRCEFFNYTLAYGNNSRQCTDKSYTIFTVPNYQSGSMSTVPILGVVSNRAGDEIYYKTCPYLENEPSPSFNRSDPTNSNDGWTSSIPPQNSDTTRICYIAIRTTSNGGSVCQSDGSTKVTISSQSKDAVSNDCMIAGSTITGSSYTTNTGGNTNTGDDYRQTAPKIPSLDLETVISANLEGSYPGALPGDAITYTVQYAAKGNVSTCNAGFTTTLSSWIDFNPSDYTIPMLEGMVDQNDNPIGPVPLELASSSTDGSGNHVLNFSFGPNYQNNNNICLPAGYKGFITLPGSINNDTPNETNLVASNHITEYGSAVEDILNNNDDLTSVTVRRTDLQLRKSGKADSNNDGQYTTRDSTSITNPGESIRYSIEYNNLGNVDAKDSEIFEKIPEGTCFKVGSVTVPAGGSVIYYSDANATTITTPTGAVGSQDCSIKSFKIFIGTIGAPANIRIDNLENTKGITSLGLTKQGANNVLQLANERNLSASIIGSQQSASPIILDNGSIAWKAWNNSTSQDVYYYNGNEVLDLSILAGNTGANSYLPSDIIAGTNGSVAWSEFHNLGSTDVYFYPGTGTGALNLSLLGGNTGINAVSNIPIIGLYGNTVIREENNGSSNTDIYYYNGNNVINLSKLSGNTGNNFAQNSIISADGHIVWKERNNGNDDLYYYDGLNVINLSVMSGIVGGSIELSQFVGNSIYWVEGSNLYYYNGTTVKNISSLSGATAISRIPIGYTGEKALFLGNQSSGNTYDLYYYNGTNITNLSVLAGNIGTNNAVSFNDFGFLDNGTIYWLEQSNGLGSQYFLYYYDGTSVINLHQSLPVYNNNIDIRPSIYKGKNGAIARKDVKIVNNFNGTTTYPMSLYSYDQGVLKSLSSLVGNSKYGIGGNPTLGENNEIIRSEDNNIYLYTGVNISILGSGGGNIAFHSLNNIVRSNRNDTTKKTNVIQYDGLTNKNISNLVGKFQSENYNPKITSNGYVTWSDNSNDIYLYDPSIFQTSGSYTTVIGAPVKSTVGSRDKLIFGYEVPANTSLSYTLYPTTTGAICNTASGAIAGFENRSITNSIDISGLPNTVQTFCVQVHFSTTNPSVTPRLTNLLVSWQSPLWPVVTFDVVVQPDAPGTIPNIANITTSSSEITTTNNSDSHIFSLVTTDLQINKYVNKVATSSGETLIYTLDYSNNGPGSAGGIIKDTLPNGVSYLTASVAPIISGDILTWDRGLIPVGSGGSIIISALVTTGAPNTVLTNASSITITGYCAIETTETLVCDHSPNIACTTSADCGKQNFGYCTNNDFLTCTTNADCLGGGNGTAFGTSFGTSYGSASSQGVGLCDLAQDTCTTPSNQFVTQNVCYKAIGESNITNNSSNATSVLGDFAGVFITANQPTLACLSKDIPLSITYGSNGNTTASGVVASISLATGYSFVNLSGNSTGRSYNASTHTIDLTSIDLSTGDVGTFIINVRVNNYQYEGVPQIIQATISTTSDEFNYSDNTSISNDLVARQCDFGSLDGYLYHDINKNAQFDSNNDLYIKDATVSLSGIDVHGTPVYKTTNTDSNGYYFFGQLMPGNYRVSYGTSSLAPKYIPFISNGGLVTGNTIPASGSLQGGTTPLAIDNIQIMGSDFSRGNSFSVYTDIVAYDLSINKKIIGGYMMSGSTPLTGYVDNNSVLTYRIEFINSGTDNKAVTISDFLSSGQTFSGISASSITVYSQNTLSSTTSTGTQLYFKDVYISPNIVHFIEYQVLVGKFVAPGTVLTNDTFIGSITNDDLSTLSATGETDTSNNTAQTSIIDNAFDRSIRKIQLGGNQYTFIGDTLTYQLEFYNRSIQTKILAIQDILPAQFAFSGMILGTNNGIQITDLPTISSTGLSWNVTMSGNTTGYITYQVTTIGTGLAENTAKVLSLTGEIINDSTCINSDSLSFECEENSNGNLDIIGFASFIPYGRCSNNLGQVCEYTLDCGSGTCDPYPTCNNTSRTNVCISPLQSSDIYTSITATGGYNSGDIITRIVQYGNTGPGYATDVSIKKLDGSVLRTGNLGSGDNGSLTFTTIAQGNSGDIITQPINITSRSLDTNTGNNDSIASVYIIDSKSITACLKQPNILGGGNLQTSSIHFDGYSTTSYNVMQANQDFGSYANVGNSVGLESIFLGFPPDNTQLIQDNGMDSSIKIKYGAGMYGSNGGGAMRRSQLATSTKIAKLEFDTLFETGFSFGGSVNTGGKMHGLSSLNCPGDGLCSDGINVRFMRRPVASGTGVRLAAYIYHKDKPVALTYGQDIPLLNGAPQLTMNIDGSISFPDGNSLLGTSNDYGPMDTVFGYPVTRITDGQEFHISLEVGVNSAIGVRDGYIRVYLNGSKVLDLVGLEVPNPEDTAQQVNYMLFQTFHGGGDSGWAPLTTSYARFDNFKLQTVDLICHDYATVGGSIVLDENMNNYDTGDAGISGIIVSIINKLDASIIATGTTDSSGNYLFTTIPYGDYTISYTNNDINITGFNNIPNTGNTGTSVMTTDIHVTPFEIDTGNIFVLRNLPGTITGQIIASDGSSTSGIIIALSNGATGTTNNSGYYSFTGIVSGNYTVSFIMPTNYTGVTVSNTLPVPTNGNQVANFNIDPLPGTIAGQVVATDTSSTSGILVTLSNGTTTLTDTSGNYVFSGLISGNYSVSILIPSGYSGNNNSSTILLPTNGNQVANFNIDPLPGTIAGQIVATDTSSTSGILVTLSNGTTTLTDTNGNYVFSGLISGNYSVSILIPSGYSGNNNSSTILLPTNGNQVANFSISPQYANISGKIAIDQNNSKSVDSGDFGVAHQEVILRSGSIIIATGYTDDFGVYNFTGIVQGIYSISYTNTSSYIPFGNTIGTIEGQQQGTDESNTMISNITIGWNKNAIDYNFYLNNPSHLIITKTIDGLTGLNSVPGASHNWLIDILNSGSGTAFNVSVEDIVNASFIISSWSTTQGIYDTGSNTWNIGDIIAGSHAQLNISGMISTGFIGTVINTGTIKSYSGTNTNSGNTESSASVNSFGSSLDGHIYYDQDHSNNYQDTEGLSGAIVHLIRADGTILQSEITNESGTYRFNNIIPGNYSVQYIPVSGYTPWSSQYGNAGGSSTDQITINNLTITAGMNAQFYDFGTMKFGSLVGTLFTDMDFSNSYTSGEELSNIIIHIYDANGNDIGVTTTSGNGMYQFDNLLAGLYSVSYEYSGMLIPFGSLLGAYSGTITNPQRTDAIQILADQQATGYNFYLRPPYDLAIAKSMSHPDENNTDIILYTIDYSNIGGVSASSILIKDYRPAHITLDSCSPNSTNSFVYTTGGQDFGGYEFMIPSLDPQSSGIILCTGKVDSGYVLGDIVRNWVDITANGFELNTGNNSSLVDTQFAGSDLISTINNTPTMIAEEETIVYTITFSNSGNNTAYNVQGIVQIPTNVLISGSSIIPTTVDGQQYTFDLNSLSPGQMMTIIMTGTVTIHSPVDQYFTAQSSVISSSFDPQLINNIDTDSFITISQKGSLSGTVGLDQDRNQVSDGIMSGVTILIKTTTGSLITTLLTDSGGNYQWTGDIGNYTIEVISPAGYRVTTQNPTPVSIYHNQTTDAGFDGLHQYALVSGSIFGDTNKNTTIDSGENYLYNIGVHIKNNSGDIVWSGTTNISGVYTAVLPSNNSYTVEVIFSDIYTLITTLNPRTILAIARSNSVENIGIGFESPSSEITKSLTQGGGGGYIPVIRQDTPIENQPSIQPLEENDNKVDFADSTLPSSQPTKKEIDMLNLSDETLDSDTNIGLPTILPKTGSDLSFLWFFILSILVFKRSRYFNK